MRLVADLLDEVERGRPRGQHDRGLVPRDEDLLVGLGKSADRDVEPELGELIHGGRELRFAAIDHEQVGPAAEALVGHALGRVAPAQHLGHAHEVVRLGKGGLDLEAAVLGLVGAAVGEDDHRGHGEVPVQGRDVEALDAHGRGVQGKRALELHEGLVRAVVRVAGADHVAHEGVPGVGAGHLEQVLLLAALRAVETDVMAALLGEPAGDDVAVRERDGEADLGGDVGRLVVVALDEAGLELVLAHVGALVQDELDRADRAALAHHEDAGAADGLLAVEADEVHVHVGGEHDLLLDVERGEALKAFLEAGGALEVEVGRGLAHLVGELAHDGAPLALQEVLDLADVAGVLDRVDGPAADAGAAAHVVVEAGAALAREHDVGDGGLVGLALEQALGALPLGAGGRADGHELTQSVDGLARSLGVGIGAEVASALAVLLARVLDGREDVRLGDGDVGV